MGRKRRNWKVEGSVFWRRIWNPGHGAVRVVASAPWLPPDPLPAGVRAVLAEHREMRRAA